MKKLILSSKYIVLLPLIFSSFSASATQLAPSPYTSCHQIFSTDVRLNSNLDSKLNPAKIVSNLDSNPDSKRSSKFDSQTSKVSLDRINQIINGLLKLHSDSNYQLVQIKDRRAELQVPSESIRSDSLSKLDKSDLHFDTPSESSYSDAPTNSQAKGQLKFSVLIESDAKAPIVLLTPTQKNLVLPENFEVSTTQLESSIRQWLVGNELHPYIGSKKSLELAAINGRTTEQLRPIQREAFAAYKGLLEQGAHTMLNVAPGGTGKTEFARHVIVDRITTLLTDRQQTKTQKLIIVLGDQRLLLRQLKRNILPQSSQLASVVGSSTWGDRNSPIPLRQFITNISNSDQPHILFSTTQSFKSNYLNASKADQMTFNELTDLIVIDEGHLVGAPQMRDLLPLIQGTEREHKNTAPFVLGMTATPVHSEANISEIYRHNVYWTYLDSAQEFLTNRLNQTNTNERSVSELITQLGSAITEGDVTPIDRIHFLNSLEFSTESEPMFVKERADAIGRSVLNPELYPKIFARLRPLIDTKTKGFLTTATTTEATRVYHYLKDSFPNKRFAVLTSDLSDIQVRDIDKQLRSNEIDFVITCKMLDQGIDLPNLQTYIDLTSSISPRQLVQRMARTTRLAAGKHTTQLAFLLPLNEATIRESLELIDQMLIGRVHGITHTLKDDRTIVDFKNPELLSPSDREYQAELQQLRDSIENFWKSEESVSLRTQQNLVELSRYIELHKIIPSTTSDVPSIRSLGIFASNRRTNLGDKWMNGLTKQAIEILKEQKLDIIRKSQPQKVRLVELGLYIEKYHKLPSRQSEDPEVQSLGHFVHTLRHTLNENWMDGLTEKAKKILNKIQKVDIRKRNINAAEIRLAEVSRYIEKHNDVPSKGSKDPYTRSLGIFIRNLKDIEGDNWTDGLSAKATLILQNLDKDKINKRDLATFEQKYADVSQYIEINLSLPTKYSENPKTQTLGVFVSNRKAKLGDLWIDGLTEKAKEILKKIEAEKAKKKK
jgi:superfamily II DNA or RNA helicase